jgi:hypothetical protein
VDAPLAIAALVVVALGFELRRLVELARLRRDPGTPVVIRSMPWGTPRRPEPWAPIDSQKT